MSSQSWQQALITAATVGTGPSNSVSAATLLPTGSLFTMPANSFVPGSMLRITAACQVSNVVTTPGTLTITVKFGSVVVFTSGAMQMSTTAHTTLPMWMTILLTCRAIGSGTNANFMGQMLAHGQMLSATAVADSATTHGTLLAPNTTPGVGTGFDSTVTSLVDLQATFSVSTSPTNITLQQYVLESLN